MRNTTIVALMLVAALHGEVKVLKNFTLIDGTGSPPVRAAALIMDNGRITWVGPAAQLQVPARAELLDLTGKFVMPGIINLHGLGAQKKMPYPVAKAIIDAAHKRGLRVAAHIFYLEDAKQLVEFSVDGLAHSVRDTTVDASLVQAMKSHHTWQMAATLTREASMFFYAETPPFADDPFFTRGVSPSVVQTLKSPTFQKSVASDSHFAKYPAFLETAKHNLKAVADAGVRYGFGTDAGPPGRFPGYFEQWELEIMVESGLTAMQAIVAATESAAEFLAAKDLGTLAKGKWADLLVLDRNPLQDIRNTRAINVVYIAGNRVR
jgi:imidazolonepropionase-like amidohydrolase